ncbi:MAG: alpha-glucosidase/alpha-galactosidase [Chloroflexota bacterium]
MKPVKIVIMGAGSTSFALSSLAALLREPSLRGSTLSLVDIDADALCLVHRLADRMNQEWDAGLTIESTVDRGTVLHDADYVVCSIAVGPREELWRLDWEITLKHGLRQPRAENGGPGAFAHAARNIPPVLDIARDMERLCPHAPLIILSNPLPRLCRAVTKYTRIKVIGLCHQIGYGYGLAGIVLMDHTDVEVPLEIMEPDTPPYPYGRVFWGIVGQFLTRVSDVIDIKAAGLNHFTWMLEVRDRRTGEDLYPLLRERFLAFPDAPERLTRDMLRLTGYLPVPGDTHLSEYLPYIHNPVTKPWERYELSLYDWKRAQSGRDDVWRDIEGLVANGSPGLDDLRDLPSEGIREIVVGMSCDSHIYRPAVNVPNNGTISNLPAQTIVEVPAIITGMGVLPLSIGDLPPVIAELCRREAEVVELVVDASVTGNRETALQALALDPTVDDLDVARAVLADYLEIHRENLPQFHGKWHI